jgi:hypothetical protein
VSLRIGPVGPRGLAVLAAAAVVGVVLASHGWSTYHGTTTPGSLAGGSTTRVASTPAAGPATTRPSHPVGPTSGPTSSPTSSAGSPGPLLSSEPYAQYAFQVWPGTPTAAAKAALTGLSVTVHGQAGGLSVSAGVNGQPAGASHLYPGGSRVYVVEASMGDDSGASDYNLGDDGLVVTDAQGRIVQ